MNVQGLLFDLDGTLLDTADDLGAALNHVLERHGKPTVERTAYTAQASHGSKGLLTLGFGDTLGDYDLDTLKGQFLDYYLDNISHYTDYFAEVAETLSFLNHKQIPWGIVTNKPGYLTEALLESFPLLKNCRVVVSGDTVGVAKPDPRPMRYALEQIGCQGHACLYVGDAQRDIEAGRNVGMKTIAALYGYIDKSHDNVEHWQADHHINRFDEVLTLVDHND